MVLWELSATAGGTRLVLTHSLAAGGAVADFASGWHWHLDAMEGAIDGVATPWDRGEWEALQATYAGRFA